MNTLSTHRVLGIGVKFAVLSILLLLASFALQAFAQEVAEEENIFFGEITVSEEIPADFFVSENALTPPSLVLLETEQSSTTEEVVVEEVTAPEVEQPPAVIAAAEDPQLSTDKNDYHPGETAIIFGQFFTPLKTFFIKVFGGDDNNQNYTETEEEITINEDGSFTFNYLLDSLYRPFYEVLVSTLGGEKVAETWFRDSSIGTYDQCSNDDGDGYASGDTGCRWTNGNIQSNNSTYFEGDSTIQRLWIEGYVPGSTHTVTFKYGTTKGGSHAYDYLTTWNASENWTTIADRCQDIAGCTMATEATAAMQNDPNVTDTIEPTGTSRLFTIRGGTITNVSVPSIVSGSYAGDSETLVTVTFTVGPSNGSMCSTKKVQGQDVTSCGMALWFGAHVAKGSEWTAFNGTTGAGAIAGSPYHVALDSEDGAAVGQRDNQMSAAAIVQVSSITIVKDAVPNDAQDFSFTTTGSGLSNFSLDDDGDGTLPNTRTFTGLSAGTYTVTEGATSGWNLTNLVCVDPTTNTTVNLGTRSASINLAAGENVTCTYTNTLQTGSITIVKNTVGGNGTFDFTGTLGAFNLVTADNTVNQVFNNVNAGTYNVAETIPAGWALTSATCSDGSPVNVISLQASENVTCTFTNSKLPTLTLVKTVTNNNGGTANEDAFQAKIDGNNVGWNSAQTLAVGAHTASEVTLPTYDAGVWGGDCAADGSITLAYGDNKTCSITNDDKPATLIVKKIVINDNGGTADAEDFLFSVNAGNTVSFEEDGQNDLSVNAGTYSIVEPVVSGYTTTYDNCSNLQIPNGGTVTCTITNDDQQAYITMVKVVINDNGGNAQPDDFDLTLEGNAVSSGVQVAVNPGTYTSAETLVTGYSFTGFSGDCDANGNTTVELGESKTCTLTNNDIQPKLKLVKTVSNLYGGLSEANDFQSSVNATEVDWDTFVGFNAGSYTAFETTLDGYDAGAWGGDCAADGSITLAVGEEKTCTITNSDLPGEIKGMKFEDMNGNGIKDVGDTGLSGWTIFLDADGDGNLDGGEEATNTAADGSYSFTELSVGTYKVREVQQVGWSQTTLNPSDVVLENGEVVNDINFGNFKHVSITGKKFRDLDGDGVAREANEPYLEEWTIRLYETSNNPWTLIDTKVTDETGSYSFTNLPKGSYKVCEVLQLGWIQTFPDIANNNTSPNTTEEGQKCVTKNVTTSGSNPTAANIGNYQIIALAVSKTAVTTYTRTHEWEITKAVDDNTVDLFNGDTQTVNYDVTATKTGYTDSAWAVLGTITIRNLNTHASLVANVTSVTDEISDQGVATVECPGGLPQNIAAGASLECTYSKTLTIGDDELNTATVATTGIVPGDAGTADVDFGEPTTVINKDITVTDTLEGELGGASDTKTFEYTKELTCGDGEGEYEGLGNEVPNTATINETAQEADELVTVNCYGLTVDKDAATTYKKTWTWDIDKTSQTASINLSPGQVYPVDYEVTVTATSQNSDYAAGGTITVTNPAPIATTLSSVIDTIAGDVKAIVDCPSLTVPANGSLECTYDASLPNADTRTNTAVATLANSTTYSGTAEVNFADAEVEEVDEQIEVTDDKKGVLGTVLASDTLPKKFTYTLDVGPYESASCGTTQKFNNTATLTTNDTETTDNDIWTVDAVVRCTCSLTQGYWKTHNNSFKGGAPADENWFNIGVLGENKTFYLSGTTWFNVFWTAPKGNVYYNLAHQYMAAKLNVLNGATNSTINAQITTAETLLNTYTPAQILALKGKNATTVSKQFNDLAGKFGAFNEGTTNPAGHCSEIPQ
jgi:SdrD B-like domain/Prealbumin-like fold domain